MQYLVPAKDPLGTIERLTPPTIPNTRKLFLPQFQHLMAEMPRIDAGQETQTAEIETTIQVLAAIREGVFESLDQLEIPEISPGDFGRITLAIEEPKLVNGTLHSGAEIILALWGSGFQSPVHGHAAGYIYEELLQGILNIKHYEPFGDNGTYRFARHTKTFEQKNPGIFYSNFISERSRLAGSELIHHFTALEPTMSMHYLPEHVRNGDGNTFTPIFTLKDFPITNKDIQESSPGEFMRSRIGEVFLLSSPNIPELGEHYAIITGGNIETIRGERRETLMFMSEGTCKLLPDDGQLHIFKLGISARNKFYERADIDPKYQIKN